MKTTIFLVRHAEVENPNKIIYGRLGRFRLSENGKQQAHLLHSYFKDKKIEAIYASPLLRTRQTANIISNGKIPIHYSKLLTELDLNKWEGKCVKDIPQKQIKTYKEDPLKLMLGEKVIDCQKRVIKKINKTLKKHRGKNVIIISHAFPILTGKFYYENKSLDSINKTILKKASITSLEFNEELKCNKVGYKEIVKAEQDLL